MEVVDPADLVGTGLHVGQFQVDDHRFLAAAHDHAEQGSSGLALISWCGANGATKMKSPGPPRP